jgi:hypothetical protein
MRVSIGYGIDGGTRFLAAVRGERSRRGGERMETLLETPVPPTDATAATAAAQRVREAQRRRRGLAVAALPCSEGLLRRMRVPLGRPGRARRVLPSLLDAMVPFPMEECRCVFPEIRPIGANEVSALAVVAPRAALRRRIEELRATGFDPALLVSEGLALWSGSLRESPPSDSRAARIVLYAGADRWAAAGGVGREVRWAWSSAAPTEGGPAAIAQACAPYLRRWRAEAESSDVPLEWHWCGPALPSPEARSEAECRLRSEWNLAFAEHRQPALFLARALARAAWDAGASLGQLRLKEDEHPDWTAWRARTEARAWIALGTAGALLTAVNGVGRAALRRADVAAQTELRRAAEEIAGHGTLPYGRELAVARAAAAQRREAAAPFARAMETPAYDALAATLGAVTGDNVRLHEVAFSDDRVLIVGTAERAETVVALEERLRGLGWALEKRLEGNGAFTLKGTRP